MKTLSPAASIRYSGQWCCPVGRIRPSPLMRAFVSQRLADFKVPRRIVFVAEIPNGPTGKPQRIGLAAKLPLASQPEHPSVRQPAVLASAQSATAEKLVLIWQEVLGVERTEINDNFFDLGGDSILGGQLSVRVRDAFGIELPMFQLFDTPTIAGLARWIEAAQKPETTADPIPTISWNRTLPLSPTQQRMWFLAQFEQDNAAYVIPVALRLIGPLRVDALEKGIQRIVDRHEILRTTYKNLDGDAVQTVLAGQKIVLGVEALSAK